MKGRALELSLVALVCVNWKNVVLLGAKLKKIVCDE